MTFPEFDKFFDEFVDECRSMRDNKGKEYANSANRFDNFNRISAQIGISNVQVGMVYLTKHMDSIQSYLKTGKIHSTERIRGRFIDAVTYLILIAGMASESTNCPKIFGINDTVKYIGENNLEWQLRHGDIGTVIDINAIGNLITILLHRNNLQLLLDPETLVHITNV